jgi:uncharacterized protein
MASAGRKWLQLIVVLAGFAASLAALPRVPALVQLRLEGLLPFATTGAGEPASRWLVLFLMPSLAAVLLLAFRAAPTAAGQRIGRRLFSKAPEAATSPGQFERFGPTYDTIVLGVMLLMLGVHAGFLAAALEMPAIASRLIPAMLGASLVLIGNVVPRLRPNWVAGLRSRRLLEDEQLWREVHRVFGTAFVVSGLVTIVASVATPQYGLVVGIAAIIGSLIVGLVASRLTPGTAQRAVIVVVGSVCAAQADAQAPRSPAAPIELSAPAIVAESPATFSRGGLLLHGTLARPSAAAGRTPVVLMVAGSGPTDRNGNGPLTNTNAYAMLAWGLAEQGIASFRYDKRGIGASGDVKGDPTKLTLDDYVADVEAAAAMLAGDPRFSSVILLGHSEGAGHVLQAANRSVAAAGVIMVSGQGRRLAEVIHEQFTRLADSATVARADAAFAGFLRGENPADAPAFAQPVLVPAYRGFFRSWANYDPPAEARRLGAPLLIVQGTTDLQVTMQDAEVLAAAQPRATLLRLAGVNHVLKDVASTDVQVQTKSYHEPSLPIATTVLDGIVQWIRANVKGS